MDANITGGLLNKRNKRLSLRHLPDDQEHIFLTGPTGGIQNPRDGSRGAHLGGCAHDLWLLAVAHGGIWGECVGV